MGQDYTLGHIEHKILRKQFDEPGIHMALVCAALGCPPLRGEPYAGPTLDKQFDGQATKFIADADKFRIDRDKGIVYLSPIFKWFSKDFVARYGPKDNISRHGEKTSAVLNYVAGHLNETDRAYILAGRYKVEYLKYDWSLNEQVPEAGKGGGADDW
jgi:hypothetical protein